MEGCKLSHLIQRYIEVFFFVTRKVSSLVTEKIGEDLTLEQHLAISYLANRKQCTVSELAEALMVKPSAITAQMNRMVTKGYVDRVRDEHDRRVVYLSLTDQGREIFTECQEKVHQVIAPFLSRLTEQELKQFILTYEKVYQVIEQER